MPTINGTPGDDVLTDTGGVDVVNGGDGNDIITSTGTGGDTTFEVYDRMNGDAGLDTLVVDHGRNDVAVINIGYFHATNPFTKGMDGRMWGGDGYIDYRSIERFEIYAGAMDDEIETFDGDDIVYTGDGDDVVLSGAGNDTIYAGDGDNIVRAGAGNDLIYSGFGRVELDGSTGDDTYFVADAGGSNFAISGGIVESGSGTSGGFDIVYAINSYTLASSASVERLVLAFADDTRLLNLTGNNLNQQMAGNNGNNILDGGGGQDGMYGLDGNDTFIVTFGCVIIEAENGGFDTVISNSFQLNAGAWVEVLAAPALGSVFLAGNEIAQSLFGNAGDNTLDGGGGGDLMVGFGGDDTYVVDHPWDFIIEGASGGNDRVSVAASYDLNADAQVEQMTAQNTSATTHLEITGNAFAQSITGNAGQNVLNGNGGGDSMSGGAGNDIYVVNVASDSITETSGLDIVYTLVSYTLGAGDAIEFFSTILHADTAALDLTGNEFAQTISGNAGSNRLNGAGGNDIMSGFGGTDTFVFNSALGASNVDTIADFQPSVDHIELASTRFGGLPVGALAAGAFVTGSQAGDADDRIIYDSATGALYFDSNGSASGGMTQFATLQPGLALTHMDFVVV